MRVYNGEQVNKESGLGLIEVIAALGISVIVLTAIVNLSLFTLRSSLSSKLQLEGTKIANREIELVRAFRDSTDWGTFVNLVGSCIETAPCHISTTDLNTITGEDDVTVGAGIITRYFYIDNPGSPGTQVEPTASEVRVNAVAEWIIDDPNNPREARVYTDLTDWQ